VQQPPKNGTPGQDPVSHAELNQTHEEILEYWTDQRMAEARPRELRLPEKGDRPGQEGADTGEPVSGTPDQD
jgi:hypothetical protein